MTVEMAADCVRACNNAADPDIYDTPVYLFNHFVEYFDWNSIDNPADGPRLEMFARMCGFPVARPVDNESYPELDL